MLIPYSVDVPMIRYPIANWVLMAVIALVSAGDWIAQSRSTERQHRLQLEVQVMDAAHKNDPDKLNVCWRNWTNWSAARTTARRWSGRPALSWG
jgi:hypothetical protein